MRMAAPHLNLTGVEPLVSTRPPDPRFTGGGDTCPRETLTRNGEVAAYPLRPVYGEKVPAGG